TREIIFFILEWRWSYEKSSQNRRPRLLRCHGARSLSTFSPEQPSRNRKLVGTRSTASPTFREPIKGTRWNASLPKNLTKMKVLRDSRTQTQPASTPPL